MEDHHTRTVDGARGYAECHATSDKPDPADYWEEPTRREICCHCLNFGDKDLCVPDWAEFSNQCYTFDGE